MNLILLASSWLAALLVVALIAAAAEDALRYRISNLTCGAVLIMAVMAMGIHGFNVSLWQNIVVCIAILVLGTAAFGAGWLGGGDVKLLAALGLWFDLKSALGLLAAVFLAGGVVAFLYIAARWVKLRKPSQERGGGRVPYGLAIAAGAISLFAIQLNNRQSNAYIDHLRELEAAQRH